MPGILVGVDGSDHSGRALAWALREAARHHVPLTLVVGARGSGSFARLLLGSVSSKVTHHAACPTVVIPDARRAAENPQLEQLSS